MRKIYYLLAMLAVAAMAVTMVSCGGDKDDEPEGDSLVEQLQGTWNFSEMKVTTMGQTVTLTASDLDKFAGDSGYSGYYDKVLDFDGDRVNGVSYNVKGNKINIPAWYDDMWGEVKFKGSTLHIIYEAEEQGISMTIDISYRRASRASASAFSPAPGTTIVSVARSVKLQ